MRIIAVTVLVLVSLFSFVQSAHAFYPFGGLITAVSARGFCGNFAMLVTGVRGGIFEFNGPFVWYTLPFPPRAGSWTLGIATSPGPCSSVIIGGSSP